MQPLFHSVPACTHAFAPSTFRLLPPLSARSFLDCAARSGGAVTSSEANRRQMGVALEARVMLRVCSQFGVQFCRADHCFHAAFEPYNIRSLYVYGLPKCPF